MKFLELHDNLTGDPVLVNIDHIHLVHFDDEEGFVSVDVGTSEYFVRETVTDIRRLLSLGGAIL